MSEARNDVDEVLDELHQLRVALDERFGHDPEKYFAFIREHERQLLREGWVQAPPPPPEHVRRVRQALARVRDHPELLESLEECEPDGGEDAGLPAERQTRPGKSAA
jgi:hypothetical protein